MDAAVGDVVVTQRAMTPIEALARLAAIVPPPRYPLLRFHGVVAPRHRWRDRVVPRPPVRAPFCKGKGAAEHGDAEAPSGVTTTPPNPPVPDALEAGDGRAAFLLDALVATRTLTTTGIAERVAPNVLSLAHWDRLLDRCGGRLTLRAVVTAPAAIAKMLAARRRPRAPPAAALASD